MTAGSRFLGPHRAPRRTEKEKSMSATDPEILKARIDELEGQVEKLNLTVFLYVNAILQLLADKGLTDQEDIMRYLRHYKDQYKKTSQDDEFRHLMREFFGEGDAENKGPGPEGPEEK